MLEFWIFSAIAGIGLMLNTRRAAAQERSPSNIGPQLPPKPAVLQSGQPSMTNVYHADHVRKSMRQDREAARRAFEASRDPVKTGVIPRTYVPGKRRHSDYHPPTAAASSSSSFGGGGGAEAAAATLVESPLTGMKVPVEHFHNNMTPFFGSTVTQNMDHDRASLSLDVRQGVNNRMAQPKHEIAPMFEPQKDVGNAHGMTGQVDLMKDRVVPPRARNNYFPIPRQRVGPGMGNYGSQPEDVYYKQRKYAVPKTVDQLRATSNPKTTGLEGRVIVGQVRRERGDFPRFRKNRPKTTVRRTHADNFVTTGAYRKPMRRPDVIYAKPTSRPATHVPYSGVARMAQGGRPTARDRPSHAPFRQPLAGPQFQPSSLTNQGLGARYDHGKDSIQVYANERDVTGIRTHRNNVTSVVKALMAPFLDVARPARKELMAGAKENEVGVRPQIPSKPTLYDPDAPARTTIKETTLHDTRAGAGAIKGGALKSVAYDPDAVARTTIKETTLHDTRDGAGAIKGGARKSVVYDPDAVARTTTKETTLAEPPRSNVRGASHKGVAYDPDAVARTTIKETTLHDAHGAGSVRRVANKGVAYDPDAVARTTTKETTLHDTRDGAGAIKGGARKSVVYDPDAVARTTTKETLLVDSVGRGSVDPSGVRKPRARIPGDAARTTVKETTEDKVAPQRSRNVKGSRLAGTVKDPDDVARTTGKETLVQPTREGNVQSLEGKAGGYLVAEPVAPHTQKEVLHSEYHGPANTGSVEAGGGGGGYKVARPHAKDTNKQVTSQNDYYGGATDVGPKAPPSYEDIMNAMMNETRELVLEEREPTPSSTKVAVGPESVNLRPPSNELPNDADERLTRNASARIPGPYEHLEAEGEDRGDEEENIDVTGITPAEVTREPNTYEDITAERLDPATLSSLETNPFAMKPWSTSNTGDDEDEEQEE